MFLFKKEKEIQFKNYFVLSNIVKFLDNNVDILNFIRVCKFSYEQKKFIRFHNFPNYYCSKIISKVMDSPKTLKPSILPPPSKVIEITESIFEFFVKKVTSVLEPSVNVDELFSYIPNRFNRLVLNDIGDYYIYKKYFESRLDVLEVLCSWRRDGIDGCSDGFSGFTSESIRKLSIYGLHHTTENQFIPPKLEFLRIQFKIQFDSLPTTLTTLIIDNLYSTDLEGVKFPPFLTHLQLPTTFSMHIKASYLPSTLTRLDLGNFFESPIDVGALPESLTYLNMGGYNKPLREGLIPQFVKVLIFYYCSQEIQYLPKSLEYLKISSDSKITLYPHVLDNCVNLTSVYLLINENIPLQPNCLPHSITDLTLGCSYNLTNGTLPKSLKTLKFIKYGRSMLDLAPLPNSLVSIEFCEYYNSPLPLTIFDGCNQLKFLKFGYKFDQTIEDGVLPVNLETLILDKPYNKLLPKLPRTLKHLSFGSSYNQPIPSKILPNSLETISFGFSFNQLEGTILPPNLKNLTLPFRHQKDISKFCSYYKNINIEYR
ncbi:hypothetical protein DLAC_02271 [Tieghemostelium lacteum]|uniref:FNIP repeat-containing protein n=1 Tax=Tieghemostelium lacteum TaxID=361077 RepID=A0A152A4J4_TIELA|nr:hypothetical protein DLAC_02271 [Tieghemostelium lacteum]|eukprot:KYR01162.1 hypothetical protein DLAC_02271 [Tieghemostelium lacteum]